MVTSAAAPSAAIKVVAPKAGVALKAVVMGKVMTVAGEEAHEAVLPRYFPLTFSLAASSGLIQSDTKSRARLSRICVQSPLHLLTPDKSTAAAASSARLYECSRSLTRTRWHLPAVSRQHCREERSLM